jgi:hypothetical protein
MNWKIFNLWFPFLMLGAGFMVGYILGKMPKLPTKKYPVEVTACYETKNYWYTDYIECDSVKRDTIFKDGLSIINKNIKNIKFK